MDGKPEMLSLREEFDEEFHAFCLPVFGCAKLYPGHSPQPRLVPTTAAPTSVD